MFIKLNKTAKIIEGNGDKVYDCDMFSINTTKISLIIDTSTQSENITTIFLDNGTKILILERWEIIMNFLASGKYLRS